MFCLRWIRSFAILFQARALEGDLVEKNGITFIEGPNGELIPVVRAFPVGVTSAPV